MTIKWRHQYDDKTDLAAREHTDIKCDDDSLTQQHFRDDSDINVLALRYGLDKRPLPNIPIDPSYYGDLSEVPDLRTALDIVRDAEQRFLELDPKLRARFDNSPSKLWTFVTDPENADEAVRIGLLRRPEPLTNPPATTTIPPQQQTQTEVNNHVNQLPKDPQRTQPQTSSPRAEP